MKNKDSARYMKDWEKKLLRADNEQHNRLKKKRHEEIGSDGAGRTGMHARVG